MAEKLRSGERLTVYGKMRRRDRPNLDALLSWQTGYATFEDTGLAEAVQEMNHYSTDRLEVDPDVAGLKLCGVYRVGNNSAFAHAVSELLPVEARQQSDVITLSKK